MPSHPAASNSWNQRAATSRSVVEGVSVQGGGQSAGQGLQAPPALVERAGRAGPRPGRRAGRRPPASPGSPRPGGPPGRPPGGGGSAGRRSRGGRPGPPPPRRPPPCRAGRAAQRRLQLREVAQEGPMIAAVEANLATPGHARGTRPTWARRPSRRRAGRPAPGLPWGSGAAGTATRAWCEVRRGQSRCEGRQSPAISLASGSDDRRLRLRGGRPVGAARSAAPAARRRPGLPGRPGPGPIRGALPAGGPRLLRGHRRLSHHPGGGAGGGRLQHGLGRRPARPARAVARACPSWAWNRP